MERRAAIRFVTLKGLEARVIHTEIESVDGPEALVLPRMKKWRRRFHQGRTDRFNDPRSARPLTTDLAEAISCTLDERTFSSARCFVSASDWKGDMFADPSRQAWFGKFHLH
jgi:hypothetical protein